MKNAKIIGVDFDDVLMAFNEALCLWHNANHGTSFTKKDIFSYDFEKVWVCSREEAIERIFKFFYSEYHSNALPVNGAVKALQLFEDRDIHIVTARTETISDITLMWIEEYFPKMKDRIHFVGSKESLTQNDVDKVGMCKSLGVEIFIDDSLVHATNISATGIPVLLFDNPWNQTETLPPNVERVFSWEGIAQKLQ